MNIRLDNLIPLPLLEQDISGSQVWDLQEVEFSKGTRYLVQAPSGKGKTTLLAILYGVRRDYQGSVHLDDTDITQYNWKDWARLRKSHFAYIFQGLDLFPGLTGEENIRLKNDISGYYAQKEIQAMAEQLGIAEFLPKKAGILSFGQQQRVAILRALCQPFEFLLADECFSHIDAESTLSAMEVIKSACERQGAGILLTSLNGMESQDGFNRIQL